MGVKSQQLKFPTDDCKFHEYHHFTRVIGNIWRCKYCWASKYLPGSYDEALAFTIDVKRKGMAYAYKDILEHRPNTVKILETLRGIRMTREVLDENTAKMLEQELILTLVKDKKEISAIRKEMNLDFNKEGVISMVEKIVSWDMDRAGRKMIKIKGMS